MDRTDLIVRAQKKYKFFSESITNRGSMRYNILGGKQLVLTDTEIRT